LLSPKNLVHDRGPPVAFTRIQDFWGAMFESLYLKNMRCRFLIVGEWIGPGTELKFAENLRRALCPGRRTRPWAGRDQYEKRNQRW